MLKLIGAVLEKSGSSRFSSKEGIENDMGEFSAKSVGARSSEGWGMEKDPSLLEMEEIDGKLV